jgi:hypothetical protein
VKFSTTIVASWQTMAKHIEQLILTPKEAPDGPLLEVSQYVELFNVLGDTDEVCSSNGGQRRYRISVSGHSFQ